MKSLLPIVLDIETSGIDKVNCGIWQIGAIDLNDTSEYFFEEGKIDGKDKIINTKGKTPVLEVIGKTETDLRDKSKQSQKQLLKNFFNWVDKRPMKNFLCQNPQFDVAFLEIKSMKYKLKMPFHYRSFDLHNIAQTKYFDLNKKFLIRKGEDYSGMDLTNVLKFCGMEDDRKVHNALEDCKLTGECFYRLVLGKNLFPEYSKYKIPKELLRK